jgi:hypothetical protein
MVAVASPTSITMLDSKTGTVLDGRRFWAEEANAHPYQIRETAFEDNRFTLAAFGPRRLQRSGLGGGDGITPVLISVDVGDDGSIGNPRVTNDWVWGIGKDRPVCGTAWQDSTGGWMIAGFRR